MNNIRVKSIEPMRLCSQQQASYIDVAPQKTRKPAELPVRLRMSADAKNSVSFFVGYLCLLWQAYIREVERKATSAP